MASDNLESILRSGYEAQAHRRRCAASATDDSDEITPDESPTFTHPVSPGLDSNHKYTSSPPTRRRTNPWSRSRDSLSSESGDDCDQPLTRRLSRKLSRRLSRRASSALSRFNLQQTPTEADEEVTVEYPKEPGCANEQPGKKQHVAIERRRSSLQKIKDFVASRRKDSAMSDGSSTDMAPPNEGDCAISPSESAGVQHELHDIASDRVSFSMTGAIPTGLSDFSALDGIRIDPYDQFQVQISEQMIQSSDDSSAREVDNTTTGVLTSPFSSASKSNTGAESTVGPHIMDDPDTSVSQNLKRKRSRGIPIQIPRLPSVTSILHKERSLRPPKGKPKKREPGLISPLGGNVYIDSWFGHTNTTAPTRLPASIDDIGVLPPSSMESESHISTPAFTNINSESSSGPVRTLSSPLPSSKKTYEGCPSSPHLRPTTTETVPSGASFVPPSPYVPVPDKTICRHKPVYPKAKEVAHPSRSVEGLYPDADCLSIDATISDSASVQDELSLKRMGIILQELREGTPFAHAANGEPHSNGERQSIDANAPQSLSTLDDSPLRKMEIVIHEMGQAAAFRNKASSINQSFTDDAVDLDCLAGMQGMEGTSFARSAIAWAEKVVEGDEVEGEVPIAEE